MLNARLGSYYLSAKQYRSAYKYLFRSIRMKKTPIFPIDIKNKYNLPNYLRYYLLLKSIIKMMLSSDPKRKDPGSGS